MLPYLVLWLYCGSCYSSIGAHITGPWFIGAQITGSLQVPGSCPDRGHVGHRAAAFEKGPDGLGR